jgi:TrmH family RNA methyltransferase
MLKNISIVLVEPQGDENIGMVARAMMNCGVTDLRLVNPVPFKTKGAAKWAVSAHDILQHAKVFSMLDEALADASLVVGLSRREGKLRPPQFSSEKIVMKICSRMNRGRVALVFGREDDGLIREELDQCDLVWTIPTSKSYPSLNLAQAVLLACHEIFKKQGSPSTKLRAGKEAKKQRIRRHGSETGNETEVFVSRRQLAPVLERIDHALHLLGYDNQGGGNLRQKIVHALSDLFGRGGLRHKDVNMFLGLMARIEERVK